MAVCARRLQALFWFGVLLASSAAQATPVVLDAEAQQRGKISLAGHFEAYYDASGELTQQQVSSPPYAAKFEALSGHFNGGFVDGAWWLRFTLELAPGTPSNWWLELIAPYVDRLDVWLPQREADGTETLQLRRLGGLAPLSSRDLAERTQLIRLDDLPQGRPVVVWLRAAGDRTLSLEASLWQLMPLTESLALDTVLRVGVIGMAVLMTLLSLFLGLSLRDGKFVWYSAYMAISVLLLATSEGFVSLMVLPQHPLLAVRLHSVTMSLNAMITAMMVLRLLEMPTQFPRLTVLFRLFAVTAGFAVVPSALGYYGRIAAALNLQLLLMCVLVVPAAIVLVRRRVPSAWPNLIGLSAFSLAAGLHLSKNLDWLPYTGMTQYTYQFVFVVNMLALFAGLGLRVRRTEQAAVAAQAQALAASQMAGMQLEAKVAERTDELQVEVQERRKAEEQLKQALQEQRNFLSMVSHEFRTPLSIIDASAQLVVEERLPVSPQDLQREIQKIHRATQRMVALLDTLLADDWLDSASMQLRRSRLDLVALLDDACLQMMQDSGRRIEFRPRAIALSIDADPVLLRIAINNLLENAAKYSPVDQTIEVSAGREGDERVVSVRDHGIGIRPDETERIFERHYRSPETLKRAGLGLGLFMVKRIVEQHGGSVTAGNAATGAGAEFRLRLPAATK